MRDDPQRRQRLLQVLEPLQSLDEFTRASAQSCCEATPAFVTTVIGDLVRDKFLQCVSSEGSETYQWTKRKDEFHTQTWIDQQIFGVQVTQTPVEQRPRERLINDGPEKLSNADLLAILIRAGVKGESALIGGQKLAARFDHALETLSKYSLREIRDITKAVNVANFAQIMAGIELGRRVAAAEALRSTKNVKITSTSEAVEYCSQVFHRLAVDGVQEEFHIVTLDTKHKPIMTHKVTVGTLDASLVHPREVFRPAIRDSASAVLLVHNHPSGDPTPSREDFQVTSRLTEVGKVIGIQVLDHIVVARDHSVSIREEQGR